MKEKIEEKMITILKELIKAAEPSSVGKVTRELNELVVKYSNEEHYPKFKTAWRVGKRPWNAYVPR